MVARTLFGPLKRLDDAALHQDAVGLAVYLAYGRSRSLAGKDRPVTGL
jgi:uncharacterized membrane protein YeiH